MEEVYTLYVGLDSLYIAPILKDDEFEFTTGEPIPFAPVAERSITENQSVKVIMYDGHVQDARFISMSTDVSLRVPVLPARIYGMVTGDINCQTTGMICDTGISRVPMFALGYREELSGGHYRYVWHQKGYFLKPDSTVQTRSGTASGLDVVLTYVSIPTVHVFHATGMCQKSVKADTSDCLVRWDEFFKTVVTPDNMIESICLEPIITPTKEVLALGRDIIQIQSYNGDTILYTVDGSEPVEGGSEVYSEPIRTEDLV